MKQILTDSVISVICVLLSCPLHGISTISTTHGGLHNCKETQSKPLKKPVLGALLGLCLLIPLIYPFRSNRFLFRLLCSSPQEVTCVSCSNLSDHLWNNLIATVSFWNFMLNIQLLFWCCTKYEISSEKHDMSILWKTISILVFSVSFPLWKRLVFQTNLTHPLVVHITKKGFCLSC